MSRRLMPAPPRVEIAEGAIESVPRVISMVSPVPRPVLLVSGPGATALHAARVNDCLESSAIAVFSTARVRGHEEEAIALSHGISRSCPKAVVVAVGGGRVIDVAKLAAHLAGVPLVTVPTNLAHDGICSPVSSLRDEEGRRRSHAVTMPVGVIVDVDVVRGAPPESFRAGIGDLLSNLTATLDWADAARAGSERYNAVAATLARKAARVALGGAPIGTAQFLADLARGLVDSGMAMAMAGSSRPCSGGEHLISHSLDAMLGEAARQHGLQVGLGTLVAAAARGRYLAQLQARFLEVGLPHHPHELGLSIEAFTEAIFAAPATRPERATFLDSLAPERSRIEELLHSAFVLPEVPQAS